MKGTDGKDMNVPSKTPEEIKKGLNVLYPPSVNTSYEEYVKAISCIPDALAYIQQLEERLAIVSHERNCMRITRNQLETQVEQLKRERDAAIKEIESSQCCTFCKHMPPDEKCGDLLTCFECEDTDCVCKTCVSGEKLEWRGVKEE